MFSHLTLTDYFWIFLGVVLIIFGAFAAVSWKSYPLAAGLIALGIGSVNCGLTNGFADPSNIGSFLRKTGITAFLIGLLITSYSVYKNI